MATTIISPPTVLSDQAQAEGLTLSLFEGLTLSLAEGLTLSLFNRRVFPTRFSVSILMISLSSTVLALVG
jgi:hypothetical protein